MDTATLYRTLLTYAPEAPAALLDAAARFALEAPGEANAQQLRSELLRRTDAPVFFVTALAQHADASVRADALLNPNLPASARVPAARSERSQVVLRELAKRSTDPDVLTVLASKRIPAGSSVVFLTALLENAATPLAAGRTVVSRVHDLLCDPQEYRNDDLRSAVWEAFRYWKPLAQAAIEDLTWAPMVADAACSGHLDESGWARVERLVVDAPLEALAGRPDGERLHHRDVDPIEALLNSSHTPPRLRGRVAQVLLEQRADHPLVVDRARRALAKLADDGTDDISHLLQAARSGSVDDMASALAAPRADDRVAWAVATNPDAPVNVLVDAAKRLRRTDQALVEIFDVHQGLDAQVELCLVFGPRAVPLLSAAHQLEALAAVLTRLSVDVRGSFLGKQVKELWAPLVADLLGLAGDAAAPEGPPAVEVPGGPAAGIRVRQLPWPVVRAMASEFDPVRDWLTGQLGCLFAVDGADRVFASVEATYTGAAGDLFAGLAGTGQPAATGPDAA